MPQVVDVTLANFEQVVIEGSAERPVVVEFWASWSAPCKTVGTLLETLSGELDFVLAKVNAEIPDNQQLAAYLRVTSIPDIRVFQGGQMVDAIQGALPEAQLRKRIAKFFLSEEDQLLLAAEAALEQGSAAEALQVFDSLASTRPDDRKLRYLRAKALVSLGRGDEAKVILAAFVESDDHYRAARSLLELMDFHAEAARVDTVDSAGLAYRAACKLAAAADYRAALDAFLAQVMENPAVKESPARKAMLTLFGVLGPKHELTWEYRARLNILVFI
jgi:putative thioredoxin